MTIIGHCFESRAVELGAHSFDTLQAIVMARTIASSFSKKMRALNDDRGAGAVGQPAAAVGLAPAANRSRALFFIPPFKKVQLASFEWGTGRKAAGRVVVFLVVGLFERFFCNKTKATRALNALDAKLGNRRTGTSRRRDGSK